MDGNRTNVGQSVRTCMLALRLLARHHLHHLHELRCEVRMLRLRLLCLHLKCVAAARRRRVLRLMQLQLDTLNALQVPRRAPQWHTVKHCIDF